MTDPDILDAFGSISPLPEAALRAAVGRAEALAPAIWPLHEAFCRGIKLLPGDEERLFLGLHALAAARHRELWAKLIDLARVPEEEINDLFMDHAPISLAQMMLSTWNGDADELLRLIEHADVSNEGRLALFDVLARATVEQRIPVQVTTDFLARYQRDGLADPDSWDWLGWLECAVYIGATELRPDFEAVFERPACSSLEARDRADFLARLEAAAASPHDTALLDQDSIRPVEDPVTALAWIERRQRALEAYAAKERDPAPEPPHLLDDPARDIRLTPEEVFWLGGFLTSRQVPPETMPIEMVDGFLTACTVGPVRVKPEAYITTIFGDAEPTWASEAQAGYALGLIGRMASAIALRAGRDAAHVPLGCDGIARLSNAADWAEGFVLATEIAPEAWSPLYQHKRGVEDALAIQALMPDDTEFLGRAASPAERDQILDSLPEIARRIACFWSNPARAYPTPKPIKVDKVGRNDPCPCGSGKKWKKCCALKPPPNLQ